MCHLVEMSVVFLNLGLVLHPDFHSEALLLAVTILTNWISIISGINFTMLHLPGLNII